METTISKMQKALFEAKLQIRKRRAALKLHAEKLAPLFADVEALGSEPYMTADWLYISLTGDKHKFLAFARVLRKHGFKLNPVQKGATGFNQFCNELEELPIYVTFSSTVCRRVKVGTKMVEQDVFETVCDELMPYGDSPEPVKEPADEIPF